MADLVKQEGYMCKCDTCKNRNKSIGGCAIHYTIPDRCKDFEDESVNVPLTIEELCKMGGQPVYIADYNAWAIVAIEQEGREWLPRPYLCGVHHVSKFNISSTFYYDFKARNLTVYRYPR